MKSIFIVLTLTLFHITAFAAPPTEASVERLLSLMNASQVIESSYSQMEKMARAVPEQMAGRPLNEKERQSIDAAMTQMMQLMKEEFTWEKLKPEFKQIYMTTFDQEEIEGLVIFYASPVGQSFIKKMPIVIQKSMEVSQSQMQRLGPQMMKILQQSIKQ